MVFPLLCWGYSVLTIGSFLAIGILSQLLHPPGELFDRGLAIDSRGIEGGMPEQRCQPNHIAGILRQIIAREGMPQCMGTRLRWH
jgi:hypothetical protein